MAMSPSFLNRMTVELTAPRVTGCNLKGGYKFMIAGRSLHINYLL